MQRTVSKVFTARHQLEGGGFKVRRPLPAPGLRSVGPVLMIDEMGPADYAPGEALGAPAHPHRGFETVTLMLEGEFEHRDSAGHAGKLNPGDVQWMTAGRGVVHSEMPSQRIMQDGGRVHGFQIWVNLPARLKMTVPRYQEISAAQIPEAFTADGLARVRVIAGEALGVSARIDTHTPIVCQHWILQPGAHVSLPLAADHDALLYAFAGAVAVAGAVLNDGQMGVLGDGDTIDFDMPADGAGESHVLLLAGVPLNEPVVQHGPFVMNSETEIEQAIRDYQAGRMGRIM